MRLITLNPPAIFLPRRSILIRLLLLFFVALLFGLGASGFDYRYFYQAARALPQSYTVSGFYSPIYLPLAIWPLSLLPFNLSACLWTFLISFTTLEALALIAPLSSVFILALSAPLCYSFILGNIDGLMLAGAALPIPIGVWLLALKPQMTIGLLAFIGLTTLRLGWSRTLKTWLPIALAFAASLALGMFHATPLSASWNISLWPYGLPLGLALLVYAVRKNNWRAALAAGPFLSPYASILTYTALIPLAATTPLAALLFSAASWFVLVATYH